MITIKEKLTAMMARMPFAAVRAAWIVRARIESGRIADSREMMTNNGFEIVEVDEDALSTADGREILRAYTRAWALRPDLHAERLRAAIEAAQAHAANWENETTTKSVVGTEGLSVMVCPKCGDSLQHTAVCPACAAGKLGYRHRYTCVCGGVDLVSKEAL